jgi:putative transcriptional regulator
MQTRKPKSVSGKRTQLGLELEQGAKEILAHLHGELELPSRRIVLPADVDVKQIRDQANMSQAEFARAFCINPRTLQEWEQGRRKPDATTRAYLAVIAKNRKAVLDALASYPPNPFSNKTAPVISRSRTVISPFPLISTSPKN